MTLTVVAGTRPPAELRFRTREPKPDFVEDADFASKEAMLNVRFAKKCQRVGDVLSANAAGVQVNDRLAKKNLSLGSEKRAKTFKLMQRTIRDEAVMMCAVTEKNSTRQSRAGISSELAKGSSSRRTDLMEVLSGRRRRRGRASACFPPGLHNRFFNSAFLF